MKKRINRKKIFFAGLIFVSTIALILSFGNVSSFEISNFIQGTTSSLTQKSFDFDKALCESGQDFLVQISPLGCTPAVVRSDLLEENDVPVICQLSAIKINPLIRVGTIDGISFSGQYSKEVSGIGFHPAKAALGVKPEIDSPVLNNIGYVIITLKKQPNESAMPNFIEGNLTANIKYDVKNAFGDAFFYLPQLEDSEWESQKSQYGFWNGKGYLRAEYVSNEGADISVYSGYDKISTISLKPGETSQNIGIPGFECQATMKLKLDSLENPDTFAKIRVNSDVLTISKGSKFLDNACQIREISKKGLVQAVSVGCKEDSGTSTFDLSISPKVLITVGSETKEYKLGDMLYDAGAKKLYLGYIGETKDGKRFIVPVVSPAPDSEKFKQSFIFNQLPGFIDIVTSNKGVVLDILVKTTGILSVLFTSIGVGEYPVGMFGEGGGIVDLGFDFMTAFKADPFMPVFYDPNSPLAVLSSNYSSFNTNRIPVVFNSIANPRNTELQEPMKEQYERAKADYEAIITQLSNEEYSSGITYGEEALYQEIMLAYNANQKETAIELCKKFENDYLNSGRIIEECTNLAKLASEGLSDYFVTINGQVKKVSLDGIYEPSIEDYSAEILIENAGNYSGIKVVQKNMKIQVSDTEFISLNGLGVDPLGGENSATFDISGIKEAIQVFKTGYVTIPLNDYKLIGEKLYSIKVTKINLKKLAKVSVSSNINKGGTVANFSFKIGVEQRAIKLSPEKTREIISDLDESIKTWTGISNTLGTVVETLKTSCFVAGVALVAKNFLANAGVGGLARTNVMRGKGGWYEKCADFVSKGTYSSQDECYSKNAEQIDADVAKLSSLMDKQNSEIKKLEEGITKTELLEGSSVNTSAFMQRYSPTATGYLNENLPATILDPSGTGASINKSNVLSYLSYGSWQENKFSSDTLREMELYTQVLNDPSASENLKDIARKTIYSDFSNLNEQAKTFTQASNWANSINVAPSMISHLEIQKDVKKMPYNGLTNVNLGSNKISGISDNAPVAAVQTFPDGKQYLVVLDDSAGTSKLPILNTGNGLAIYDSTGKIVDKVPADLANVYFERFDSSSYKNSYKNAKLRYYETEPYKGMPAIVPFDTNNGWYAATKQTLATSSTTTTYDASGRVSNFYLCNVGKNGIEEFTTVGDDICQLINTGTGMPYNQFPGISEAEAKTIINKAVQAINQAAKLYSSGLSGKVKILDATVEVGSPAVDIPAYSCQDFMSPSDCLLLFNLCDPVICPSSRCNLGGAYPVKDVVQSGVIGSLVLCLPNFKEGIIFPVCLTGVKAGIEGFLSVEQAYRDCLNESLETGRTVGICDELHSIYLCDFFWRQALPLTNVFIPKIIEFATGQNVRGGGEYLGVASAWSGAESAINYFVNYYGTNAKTAFLARSTEDIGGELCKVYTSMVVPSGSDLLSSLTQADSPSQFHGRFEEIPMSTATVPPTSHYKVFYHIYAGQDTGAYYKVYLKGGYDSSYYQDTAQSVSIASGYINVRGYASETIDKIATSGYKQMCINVNGQEECGFEIVSTAFAVNYIKDEYLASQATEQITKELDCVGDSKSGIIRICGTDNPGKGTDSNINSNESRWQDVGFCDNEQIRCWIDTDSVKNVIRTTTVEGNALEEVSANYVEKIISEGNYLSEDEYALLFEEIKNQNASTQITAVTNVLEKIFYTREKAQLLLLRGNAFASLLGISLAKQKKPESTLQVTDTTTTTGPTTTDSSTSTGATISGTGGERIWAAAKNLVDNKFDERRDVSECGSDKNCLMGNVCARFVVHAMIDAQILDFKRYCSDEISRSLKVCNIVNEQMVFNSKSSYHTWWEGIDYNIQNMFTKSSNFTEIKDFNSLQKGDLIILGYGAEKTQHIVIFDSYYNNGKRIYVFGDPGIICYKSKWVDSQCISEISPDPTKIENYPVKTAPDSDPWYIYRVFRYIGGGTEQVTLQNTSTEELPSGEATTAATPTDPTVTLSSPEKETVAYKIFRQASDKAYKSQDSALKLVSDTLNSIGVSVSGNSVSALESSMSLNPDFAEVNLRLTIQKNKIISLVPAGMDPIFSMLNNLQTGDIVILGMGCKKDYTVGIYHSMSNEVYFFSNTYFTKFAGGYDAAHAETLGLISRGIKLESTPITTALSIHPTVDLYSVDSKEFAPDFSDNLYITKAYRYIGDLSAEEKNKIKSSVPVKWTKDSALAEAAFHSGNYNTNQIFFDQLIFDGLISENECNQIGRTNFLGLGQKDIGWLREILQSK